MVVMFLTSMQSPETIRRWGVIGFALGLLTLALLPVIGLDYGKGAVRWLSLGFISIQPSEFVKPALAVTAALKLTSANLAVSAIVDQRVREGFRTCGHGFTT